MRFELNSPFQPAGDQPAAIEQLIDGLNRGDEHQVLLGVTGSGKTFTIANVIQEVQLPTLILAPNKTLAAQLYQEMMDFFPNNAVEYFVSYYDYFQPEAYIPSTNTYIEKDSIVNDVIDRMRLSATRSLFERNDVIIVASVSCIYGLGSAEAYFGMLAMVEKGQKLERDVLLRKLVDIQYKRNDIDFSRGNFRVRGDVVDIFPAYEELSAIRIEFFGDEVEKIYSFDPLRGANRKELDKIAIYPGSHYVVEPERRHNAIEGIKNELRDRLEVLRDEMRLVEAQRLAQRTTFDLEMLVTVGSCKGIENYARHVTGRPPDSAPPCLLDYFPSKWLMVVDESHVAIPQVGAMYRGDRARKTNLVEHGFRLPSALDNRPLKFGEFEKLVQQTVYVSATPSDYEIEKAEGIVIEQIIRPTGLLDPLIEVRPVGNQVDDLIAQIRLHVDERGERVLATTLTKRMAEDLTEYLGDLSIRTRYLHSDIDTMERMELITGLRRGDFDVLVGINLLREGLDIPEVSLVAILDADKEGFLRSARSLIQTSGRAARNVNGRVIFYADKITKSMQQCIDETHRRREIQHAHNVKNGITPKTIIRKIHSLEAPEEDTSISKYAAPAAPITYDPKKLAAQIVETREQMLEAARALQFERAAELRDRVKKLESQALMA